MNQQTFALYMQLNSTRRGSRCGNPLSVSGRGNWLSLRGKVCLAVILFCGACWALVGHFAGWW